MRYLATNVGWLNEASTNYDWGAIKLNCSIGDTVGWYGHWWDDGVLPNGLPATVSGYGGDKNGEQWWANSTITGGSVFSAFHEVDTKGGNSGSPLWNNGEGSGGLCTGPCANGIHAGYSATQNYASRITAEVGSALVQWRDEP